MAPSVSPGNFFEVRFYSSMQCLIVPSSERPKRQKSVSAETEISAKLTESSAEISAETLSKLRESGAKFSRFFYFTARNQYLGNDIQM